MRIKCLAQECNLEHDPGLMMTKGLWTVECRLRTGYEDRLGYKMQTKHYTLGIKRILGYKMRTVD